MRSALLLPLFLRRRVQDYLLLSSLYVDVWKSCVTEFISNFLSHCSSFSCGLRLDSWFVWHRKCARVSIRLLWSSITKTERTTTAACVLCAKQCLPLILKTSCIRHTPGGSFLQNQLSWPLKDTGHLNHHPLTLSAGSTASNMASVGVGM